MNELINRNKWKKGGHNIPEGTIVILREDNVQSMQWSMGRVIKVYPAADGIIRTATVYILNRGVERLVPYHVNQIQTSSDDH